MAQVRSPCSIPSRVRILSLFISQLLPVFLRFVFTLGIRWCNFHIFRGKLGIFHFLNLQISTLGYVFMSSAEPTSNYINNYCYFSKQFLQLNSYVERMRKLENISPLLSRQKKNCSQKMYIDILMVDVVVSLSFKDDLKLLGGSFALKNIKNVILRTKYENSMLSCKRVEQTFLSSYKYSVVFVICRLRQFH